MKVRFLTKQPPVRWQVLDNGMVDVTICINGRPGEEIIEDMQEGQMIQHFFEYDTNMFREKTELLNREYVESNPEAYLKYIPEKEMKLEEIIKEQQARIDDLEGCLLEVSEIIYA